MLNRLSGQDVINQNTIKNNNIGRLTNSTKNPYANTDQNLLIDETSISNEAMALYQRDLDIKKFTSLAMSNPENTDHNNLVVQNVFNIMDSDFESNIIDGIFNNRSFINDLFG